MSLGHVVLWGLAVGGLIFTSLKKPVKRSRKTGKPESSMEEMGDRLAEDWKNKPL